MNITNHPSLAEQNDQALMIAYGQGNGDAFEVLYKRHKDALYRYLFRQLSNENVANELFQDIWSSVIQAREQYQIKAQFNTWLYRIAHNRLVDYYRAQGRYREWKSTYQEDDLPNPSLALQEPEDFASRSVLAQRLTQLLAALPPPQREVFLLKEESGLSLSEIAELTNEKKETVKTRLRYATAKLKTGLNLEHLMK